MSTAIQFAIPSTYETSLLNARQGSARRLVSVGTDGSVKVFDEIANTFSIHHHLTEDEIATAQDLAIKVRAGTHWVTDDDRVVEVAVKAEV